MMTRPFHFPWLTSCACLLFVAPAGAQLPSSSEPAPAESPTSSQAASEPGASPTSPTTGPEGEGSPPPEATTPSVPLLGPADEAPAPAEELAPALPPPPSGNGGIAVFPVAATNLTEGESAALGVLFASEISEEKGGRVIAPATAGQYSTGSSDYAPAASYMNVEQYLSVEAVRLERTTIITAALHSQDGSIVRQAKMSAKSVDDFQNVAERLVAALVQGKDVEQTRTLDNVTIEETEGRNRTFVEKVFGFKASFAVPYSAQIDLPTMVGASFNGRLEAKKYFLEFGGGILLPATSYDGGGDPGYGGLFAELGGSYYLTHTNISPYVGGGVMPRILSTQPANLAVYGQAGLMFFRTSSSRLYAELRVAQNLTPMSISDYSYDPILEDFNDTTVRAWPIEFGVNVGLGW